MASYVEQAFDQQQKGLVDAASQALSYRQEILEENIRLTYALQVAEQERGFYVQSLMPLLAEFDLQPAVSDAHSMVSHIKILVQKLRSELELMEVPILPLSHWKQYITP
jgi:multidrug efflux pump subunit AcrA (membrane-fusion protein)